MGNHRCIDRSACAATEAGMGAGDPGPGGRCGDTRVDETQFGMAGGGQAIRVPAGIGEDKNRMIEKLTSEQEALLPIYRDKWLKYGLSTEPMDKETALLGIKLTCEAMKIKEPRKINWLPSLMACLRLRGGLLQRIFCRIGGQIKFEAHARHISRDPAYGPHPAQYQLIMKIGQYRMYYLSEGICTTDIPRFLSKNQAWEQTEKHLRDHVAGQFVHPLWQNTGAIQQLFRGYHMYDWDRYWGQYETNKAGTYDYFRNVCGLKKETDEFNGLILLTQSVGFFVSHENAWFVSDRPVELHYDSQYRLHHDGGMAIRYRDGWGRYALHGRRVPQWLAETSASDLDPKHFSEIDNVEIRREFIRKVGIERVSAALNPRVIDTRNDHDYQLLEFNFGNGYCPRYLKMRNATVPGIWHIEQVSRRAETVQQAINCRAYGQVDSNDPDWCPEQLT